MKGVRPYDYEAWSERLDDVAESPKRFRDTAAAFQAAADKIAARGDGWNGTRKVFISDVAKETGAPVSRIAGPLLIANNKGWLELQRADLVGAMDEDSVRRSEIESPTESRYHFVIAKVPGLRGVDDDDDNDDRPTFFVKQLKAKRDTVAGLQEEIADSKKAIASLSKRKLPAKDAPDHAYQRYCRSIEHEWNELRARERAIATFTKKPDPETPRPSKCPPPMKLKFFGKDAPERTDADRDYDWAASGFGDKMDKPAGYDERKRAYDDHEANAKREYAEYKSRGLWGPRRVTVAPMKCVKVKNPLSMFDRRSIRTVTRGSTRVLVGCPKGAWQPRKQRCKVGLRAYETITPGRCKRGSGGKTKRS